MKALLAIVLLLSAGVVARAQGADDVRIYRCTDAAGKQSLRDTPCPKGQRQQVREMLRPKDAPTGARPASTPAPALAPPAAAAQTVYLAPPQPMYECVTDEGKRYTDRDADAGRASFRPAPSPNASIGRPQQSLPTPTAVPTPRHGRVPWPVASGGGTWVRDDCALLPPRETCARLRDRRDEIRARFFNAMPSERDVLRAEQRTIDARLADDCNR